MFKQFLINKIFNNKPKDLLLIFYQVFAKFNAAPKIMGLKLNKNTALGRKGDMIYLPFDKYITWWVIKEGEYKHFLLKHISKIKNNIVFIDIGANTGLVSKQIYNLKKDKVKIYSFEPDTLNYHCLAMNLKGKATCNNFGLSDKNTQKNIYKFNDNHGKSSLIKKNKFDNYEKIKVRNINSELSKILINLNNNDKVVIKLDTEGYDLFLISLIDHNLLKKIDYLCFEYQNIDNYKFNKGLLLEKLQMFRECITENKLKISLSDIINLKINKQIDFVFKK